MDLREEHSTTGKRNVCCAYSRDTDKILAKIGNRVAMTLLKPISKEELIAKRRREINANALIASFTELKSPLWNSIAYFCGILRVISTSKRS
jgi:hypothetical protein